MIVTLRNDFWFTPPPYAHFDGSDGGIPSGCIPYGNRSHSSPAEPENLRLTARFAGVVLSTLDGAFERGEGAASGFGPYDFTVAAPDTMRILSWPTLRLYYTVGGRTLPEDRDVETMLISKMELAGDYYRDGIALGFGSRVLDTLCGNQDPPVSTLGWSPDLPYSASDAAAWNLTWPVFSELRCDTVFYPYPSIRRASPTLPLESNYYVGDDLSRAATAIYDALSQMTLPVSMQDVLAYDTGMTAADFAAHWRNGATRLDWKRLGIVCQIERQCEITYERSQSPGMVTCDASVSRRRPYTAIYRAPLAVSANPVTVSLQSLEWAQGDDTTANTVKRSTDEQADIYDVNFVTARAWKPSLSLRASGNAALSGAGVSLSGNLLDSYVAGLGGEFSPIVGAFRLTVGISSAGEFPDSPRAKVYARVKRIQQGQRDETIGGSSALIATLDFSGKTVSAAVSVSRSYLKDGRLFYSSLNDIPADKTYFLQSMAYTTAGIYNRCWSSNRIAKQRLWTLSAYFGAANGPGDLTQYITNDAYNGMRWDDVKTGYRDPERKFWFHDSTPLSTLDAVQQNIFTVLSNCETQCRNAVSERTEYAFGASPGVSLSAADLALLDAESAATSLAGSWGYVSLLPEIDVVLDVVGTTDPATGAISYHVATPSDDTSIGYLELTFTEVIADVENANARESRFDCYSESVSKTLWSFNNLRDPAVSDGTI